MSATADTGDGFNLPRAIEEELAKSKNPSPYAVEEAVFARIPPAAYPAVIHGYLYGPCLREYAPGWLKEIPEHQWSAVGGYMETHGLTRWDEVPEAERQRLIEE